MILAMILISLILYLCLIFIKKIFLLTHPDQPHDLYSMLWSTMDAADTMHLVNSLTSQGWFLWDQERRLLKLAAHVQQFLSKLS